MDDEIIIIKEEGAQPTNIANNIPTHEYDVIYENQRGLFVLGVPKFSSKALGPTDPPSWTDKNQKFSLDIHTFQLPNPSWEWVYEEWMIDMSDDIDEEGWEYSFDFHCANWHGHYQLLRSFVRRRRWIRLRRLKINEIKETPADDPPRSNDASESNFENSEVENLWHKFKTSKSDREKITVVKGFIANGGDLTCLDKRLKEFVELFDHQESRRIFLELLLMYGTNQVSANSPMFLDFFSDVREMLEHVKDTLDTRYSTKGGNTELTSN